jgi:hypothetical protein
LYGSVSEPALVVLLVADDVSLVEQVVSKIRFSIGDQYNNEIYIILKIPG